MDPKSPVFISKAATEQISKLSHSFDRPFTVNPALIPYVIDVVNNLRPYVEEGLYLKIMEKCYSVNNSPKTMPGIKVAGNIFELIKRFVTAKPEDCGEINEVNAEFRANYYSKNSDIICRIYDEAYENYQKTLSK